jgi:Pyruvate/2-oxoacid:ferredoxin oxidoreductase delta subunit
MIFAHVVSGQGAKPRNFLLKAYARREVSLLKVLFRLLHSPLMRNRLVSSAVYLAVVRPMAGYGITGTPLAPRDLEEFVEALEPSRFAVGPCRCRKAHGTCDHAMETDIYIKSGVDIWLGLFPDEYREITAGEVLEICRRSHSEGMAQILYSHLDIVSSDNYFVICNCCADGCLPLLSLAFYGAESYPFNSGPSRAFVEYDRCEGCRTCVEVCPFQARYLKDGKSRILDCKGCGLCATNCPHRATMMV